MKQMSFLVIAVVLGYLTILLLLLYRVVCLTAEIADCDFSFFTILLCDLCQFFPALFCEVRDHKADVLAVVRRRDAEVGDVDSTLDVSE